MTTSYAPVTIGEQAEELIRTLPGVVSVRVVGGDDNSVREVHVLTTSEVSAKQTVRNVESALFAHLGMRIDHRRISVAATTEAPPPAPVPQPLASAPAQPTVAPRVGVGRSVPLSVEDDSDYFTVSTGRGGSRADPSNRAGSIGNTSRVSNVAASTAAASTDPVSTDATPRRRLYFEDVEVRGSRTRGVSCRVTLAKDGTSYIGEARGVDGDRARLELAARATCLAIGDADGHQRQFGLEGVRVFEAFERKFVFVGVTVRYGREARMLSGTCEVIDSAETAAVLAVLDATNRWVEYGS